MQKKIGNYQIVKIVGSGQFGTVYQGFELGKPDLPLAIKQVEKAKLLGQRNDKINSLFRTELSIMSFLKHPNIIQMIELLETGNNYYIVMPFCEGGDIYSLIQRKGRLSEKEALMYLIDIMNGFQELYKHKIMHRDIKNSNIFLKNGRALIGDFGFAKFGAEITETALGTKAYMAPEILFKRPQDRYTNKVDLWSIGICLYEMIFANLPFPWEDEEYIKLKGIKGMLIEKSGKNLYFPKDVLISEECKDLLVNLIQFSPEKRLTWKEFFEHPFFSSVSVLPEKKSLSQPANSSQTEFLNNRLRLQTEDKKEEGSLETDAKKQQLLVLENEKNLLSGFDIYLRMTGLLNPANERLVHEQRAISFMLKTAFELINLSQIVESDVIMNIKPNFEFAAIAVFKKVLLLIEPIILCLQRKTNLILTEGFEIFIQSKEALGMQNFFENKHSMLWTFLQHFISEVSKSWTDDQKNSIKSLLNFSSEKLESLNLILADTYTTLKRIAESLFLTSENADLAFSALMRLAYTAKSEVAFPFLSDGKLFDWNHFFQKNNFKD